MEYRKEIKTIGLVLAKQDIKKLISSTIEIVEKGKLEIEIEFKDGLEVKFTDVSIFSEDIIDEKVIKNIRINVLNNKAYVSFYFELEATFIGNDSKCTIKTDDQNLYLIIEKTIEERIKNIKRQPLWPALDSTWFVIIIGSFLAIVIHFFSSVLNLNYSIWEMLFLGYSYSIPIIWALRRLFPCVEFEFGKKNIKLYKERRNKIGKTIGLILTTILIPIILSKIFKL